MVTKALSVRGACMSEARVDPVLLSVEQAGGLWRIVLNDKAALFGAAHFAAMMQS